MPALCSGCGVTIRCVCVESEAAKLSTQLLAGSLALISAMQHNYRQVKVKRGKKRKGEKRGSRCGDDAGQVGSFPLQLLAPSRRKEACNYLMQPHPKREKTIHGHKKSGDGRATAFRTRTWPLC